MINIYRPIYVYVFFSGKKGMLFLSELLLKKSRLFQGPTNDHVPFDDELQYFIRKFDKIFEN